jgi:hypothetical protein
MLCVIQSEAKDPTLWQDKTIVPIIATYIADQLLNGSVLAAKPILDLSAQH